MLYLGRENELVKELQEYLDKKFPEKYEVLALKSDSEDGFYNAMAKYIDPDPCGGEYVAWTCWNRNTKSLNHGHYNLEEKDALGYLTEGYSYGDDIKLLRKTVCKVLKKWRDDLDWFEGVEDCYVDEEECEEFLEEIRECMEMDKYHWKRFLEEGGVR